MNYLCIMKSVHLFLLFLSCMMTGWTAGAQDTSLSRYPEYAYAGEWDTRHPDRQVLRIIKDGKVEKTYVKKTPFFCAK